MIIIATLIGYTFALTVILVCFLICSVIFLQLLTLTSLREKREPIRILSTLPLCIMACILSIAIFILIPRPQNVDGSSSMGLNPGESWEFFSPGFANSFYLGSFKNILNDTTTVLEVTFHSPTTIPHCYLRGNSLDRFDGLHWSSSASFKDYVKHPKPGEKNIRICNTNYPESIKSPPDEWVSYSVNYIGLGTDVIFGIPAIMGIENHEHDIKKDENECLRQKGDHISGSLKLLSLPTLETDQPIYHQLISQDEKKKYLRFPYRFDVSKYKNLSEEIITDLATDYEKSSAICEYLRTNYLYSLHSSSRAGKDAVSEFLFNTKRGHCEYFASAMALMLRSIDVPSRVSVGFVVDMPDISNGTAVKVRNNNAHVWIEAYCDDKGWFLFDPTPPAPMQVRTHNMMFTTIFQWCDDFGTQTRSYIGRNAALLQQRMYEAVSKSFGSIFNAIKGPEHRERLWQRIGSNLFTSKMILFLIIVGIIDVALIWLYLKTRQKWAAFDWYKNSNSYNPRFLRLYREILKWLGVESPKEARPHTLKEMVLSSDLNDPERHQRAVTIINLYYSARYDREVNFKTLERNIRNLMKKSL
jgi:hypothetical protein